MNCAVMISVKNEQAVAKMTTAGQLLATIFEEIPSILRPGVSTLMIDHYIEQRLGEMKLVSGSMGYKGYRFVSCISLNDVVVHGVPNDSIVIVEGDLVKIDVCAAYQGYFADMTRSFCVDPVDVGVQKLVSAAYAALDKGVEAAWEGNRLSDISAAIQKEAERNGFGVVRDFAGHGIGRSMHEDPEILNYGKAGRGPVIKSGMAFALEPMITMRDYQVYIADDGWTVKTVDGGYAAHVEDTVIITDNGPKVITRLTL